MIFALCIIIIVIAFVSGYVVSLYALAAYIEPDEVRTLMSGASRRWHTHLARLTGDPRAIVKVATVFRPFNLIVITVCAIVALTNLATTFAMDVVYVYPPGLVLTWLLYVFFVEFMPRRFSRRIAGRRMIGHLWLITAISVLFFPVVRLYKLALSHVRQERQVTEEEKEEIIGRAIETLAEQAGISETIVEEEEKEMIGQIFLLDQTLVREIMAPRIDIAGIEKTTKYSEIQEFVRRDGYSRYPVYEESIDRIIGVLYVKDLFSNMPAPGEEFVIADYLRKPYFIPESKVIGELLHEFLSRKIHIAIVVDEYGGVAGLVTLEDILEEIVGEIQDEHDREEAEWKALPDGRYMIDAGMRAEKLQDYLDTNHEQGDYETVGGLIYDIVGSVPDQGSLVKWYDIEFEIAEVDGQRIRKVIVLRRT